MEKHGRELVSPPEDAISRARFSLHSNKLLVSSWDSSVTLYDVDENVARVKFSHPTQPLDCCFLDDFNGLSGDSDGTVRRYNFSTQKEDILGKHEALVNSVEFSEVTGQIITGSWDKNLRFWDARVADGSERTAVHKCEQPAIVECMSLAGYYLVVASGITTINIYDLRNVSRPMQERRSPLKYKTVSIGCYPNHLGYAIGSVDGRVALEFFDLSESLQTNSYAFRCLPKSKNATCSLSAAVNAIEYHPIYGSFSTGDNDGYCLTWNGEKKKMLYQYPRYPSSIASLSYNRDGQLLAVASSYTYQGDEKMNETTHIFIENVNDAHASIV
jgi:cell cycle arrest protein BUB3